MMDVDVVLGLDIGTSHVKAIFYSSRGIITSGCSNPITIFESSSNQSEQNPSDWILAIKEAIKNALGNDDNKLSSRIKAIGVSGQQHGMIALDKDGDAVRPCKLWCDTEAYEEAAELSKMFDKTIPSGYTAPKILWYQRHELDNYKKTEMFMLPHDYINYYLSGKKVWTMEYSDVSGTGLFDIHSKTFDSDIIQYIDHDLINKLPPIHRSFDNPIGLVSEDIALELFPYYKSNHGILLSCGGGDNAMSALGVGLTIQSKSIVLSLGTSGTLFGVTADPIVDTMIAPFCDCTGNYLPLICIQNCSNVCEEFRKSYGPDMTIEDITKLGSQECTGAQEGLVLLPYISAGGERTPNLLHACGVLYGIKTGHLQRPGLLYRVALESVTFGLYRGYSRLIQLGYPHPGEILLVGGGAKNELWRRIIADIFQLPVRVSRVNTCDESNNAKDYSGYIAAVGAAYQAFAVLSNQSVNAFINTTHKDSTDLSADITVPNVDTHAAYKAQYKLYDSLCNILSTEFHWA